MKRSACLVLSACLGFVVGGSAAVPADGAASDSIVLAQDLLKVKASGFISAALWTRRERSYTLQLVFPPVGDRLIVGTRIQPVSTVQVVAAPDMQVWLLRSNGTQIMPLRTTGPTPKSCVARCIAQEKEFTFELVDGAQAVAVAIQVGGEFYIEKLKSLEPQH